MRPTCSIMMYLAGCPALCLYWLLPDYPKVWLPFLILSLFFAGWAIGRKEVDFDLRKALKLWN